MLVGVGINVGIYPKDYVGGCLHGACNFFEWSLGSWTDSQCMQYMPLAMAELNFLIGFTYTGKYNAFRLNPPDSAAEISFTAHAIGASPCDDISLSITGLAFAFTT